MIKARPLPVGFMKWGASVILWFVRKFFNKMIITGIEIKPGHSYLLMCNHFGFLDGFLAFYLMLNEIDKKQKIKGIYMMSLKKQMEKNWWLKYIGAFSISPGIRSIEESLNYASEILSEPNNLLLFYPQQNLESSHIRTIEFKEGISVIVPKIKGKCQLIWCSILMEYFESTRPSVYFNMLDCGTNQDFDFEKLKADVNKHHRRAIEKNIRFTKEDIKY
jgi:hypothetical protein